MRRWPPKTESDNQLLIEASQKAGSQRKLARLLHVHSVHLGLWIRRKLRPTNRMILNRQFDIEDVISQVIGRPVTIYQIFPEVFGSFVSITETAALFEDDEGTATIFGLRPPSETDPLETCYRVECARAIDKALVTLTPREEKVLVMLYGLRGTRKHTIDATAEHFQVKRERIRQIEMKALKKLRAEKRSVLLAPFDPHQQSEMPETEHSPGEEKQRETNLLISPDPATSVKHHQTPYNPTPEIAARLVNLFRAVGVPAEEIDASLGLSPQTGLSAWRKQVEETTPSQ